MRVNADKDGGLCFVGALPPPTHGLSTVNQAVRSELENLGLLASVVDLSSGSLTRSWKTKLSRLIRFFRDGTVGIHSLLTRKSRVLYIGLSAGYGQIYDCLFVLFGRLCGASIYLHHHSFSYLRDPVLLSRLLIHLAGVDASHIVLCKVMERELRDSYRVVRKTHIISNAVFLDSVDQQKRLKRNLEVIGYFGNVCPEKGIEEFLELMSRAGRRGYAIRGIIGGAFQDKKVELLVKGKLQSLNNVNYVGPKYGKDKLAFFSELDVLLFPSSYRNEAEPLTILEAMSLGVPVIVWETGCVRSMLSQVGGRVIEPDKDFVDTALEQILNWKEVPGLLQEVSRCAMEQHRNMHAHSQPALRNLLVEISEKC